MTYNGKNRKINAQKTKEKIYESGKKLFLTKHYTQVSVDEIVKMAGVSKGSFYVHYPSKEALVASLLKDHMTQVETIYKNFIDAYPDDAPPETIFLSLIAKITEVLIDMGCDKMQALYQAQISNDVNTEITTSYDREIYKIFSQLLDRGIKRGEFATEKPLDDLTKHFVMAIRGITYEWCIRSADFDYTRKRLRILNYC
jgi:AcrR family transcriptional regulator